MASRVFALIIGIDNYKSGAIWNLESCADDAHNIKRWLCHDLHVPRDQICILLNSTATKRSIEDNFMRHLVNNPAIDPGDAILVYFAGHGSTIRSPPGWFGDRTKDVEVLCPYDYDTRSPDGRVAGICERSLHAMLADLHANKGNNITVILDTCFLPQSRNDLHDRQHTRWTPTTKASPEDLNTGLWRSALAQPRKTGVTYRFTEASYDTHVMLVACGNGAVATESKAGGNLTHALMSLKGAASLHQTTYSSLVNQLAARMDDHQRPICLGRNTSHILFDGIPFFPDAHYISVDSFDDEKMRVDAGSIHGITEGTEFSVHPHNRRGSLNPVLATCSAIEVHPTWCIARRNSKASHAVGAGWARITRWNNRVPFRVHIRRSLCSLLRRCRLRRKIPSSQGLSLAREGINLMRVHSVENADVSVTLRRRDVVVERHDNMIAANCRRIIHLPSEQSISDLKIIESAAYFHLHLHRENPQRPLYNLVTMELFRLDSTSWDRASGDLLVNGKAEIVDDEKNSIYSVVLHNNSDVDLWPYLAYMDASGYGITMVHHPPSSSLDPPLRKHSEMVIGSGTTESEALSFTLSGGADAGAGFLKLFVSSAFAPMMLIEQGVASSTVAKSPYPLENSNPVVSAHNEVWDSVVACVTVVRGGKSARKA